MLKLDKSKEVKPEHPENIQPISFTFWVLKCDKSKEVKPEQPENIRRMYFTSEVLRYSNPTI